MRTTAKIVVLALAVLLSILGQLACGPSHAAQPVPTAALAVAVARAEHAQVPRVIGAEGGFIAVQQSNLAPHEEGVISSTPVDVGSYVRRGQVIATLDPVDFQLRERQASAALEQARAAIGLHNSSAAFQPAKVPSVASAHAALLQAQARDQLARNNLHRYRGLVASGDVAESVFDQISVQARSADAELTAARQQYRAALDMARQGYAQVAAAQSALALSNKGVRDTRIVAPFAGWVAARPVAVGEHVTLMTNVATVVQLSPLKLQLRIPQQDVSELRLGQAVLASVSGFSRPFQGKLSALSPALDATSRALLVEATFRNQRRLLRPGMFAHARIVLPGARAVAVVPASAVVYNSGTDSDQIFTDDGGVAHVHVVQLSRPYNPAEDGVSGTVQVLSGLPADATVITSGVGHLVDGAKVRPQPVAGGPGPSGLRDGARNGGAHA